MRNTNGLSFFVAFFYTLFLLAACGGGGGGSDTQSSTSSRGSAISQSSSSAPPQLQDFLLQWTPPKTREDGTYFELHELGGYELRYTLGGQSAVQAIMLSSQEINITLKQLPNNTQFEIAAFDTDGLYSNFVAITSTRSP